MFTEPRGTAADEQLSEMSPCNQCGRPNDASKKYCSHCGAALWEVCCRCGASSRAGDEYCGSCGANLLECNTRFAGRYETMLATAKELQAECRYDEAIGLLGQLGPTEHPRLQEYVNQARQRISQLTIERDRLRDEAEAAHAEARALLAGNQYDAAASVVDKIPPAMRSEEAEHLRLEIRTRLEEVASLERELSSAVASPRTLRLLPKVSHLLALQPDHNKARQLAEEFRDCVVKVARHKLARHEYEDARKLLDQLPETARNAEYEELRRQAAELVWLSKTLRLAPFVDATLLEVAERFARMVPDDQRAAKLLQEVRRRQKIAAGKPQRAYPPWAPPPEKTELECPVEWLTGFRRIAVNDELAEEILVDHPGCLFVACGLALQGLEQAPIRINLYPKDERTRLGRVADILQESPLPWIGRRRKPCTAWGLDLSASGLKAIKLAWQDDENAVITGYDVITHRKLLSEAFSDSEAKTLVETTLGTFCSRNDVKVDRICLGLPTRMLLTRNFTMPSADPAKLEKAIAYEARRHLPIPLQAVSWGYQVLGGGADTGESSPEDQVFLVAARRPQLVDRLSSLKAAGLHVDVVQSDCVALHNFLCYDHFGIGLAEESPQPDTARHIALLDIGGNQTHLVVSSPNSIWYRSSGCGGEQFTKALVRELRLTAAEAEDLKRQPAGAGSLCQMYTALEPALESLAADARSLLNAFAAASGQSQRIERVLGCGGSFRLHGLLRYLRSGF